MKLHPYIAFVAVMVLAVLILTTIGIMQTRAADNPCALSRLPPPSAWQVPTVPMEIDIVPASKIVSWCHKMPGSAYTLYACTFLPNMTPNHDAVILLSDALTADQRVCVLLYEESHIAPNNWYDPAIEASIPGDPAKGAGKLDTTGMHTGR